jgi:hypothetical protein
MISHMWTIPCSLIITDRETNLVSYIGTVESAQAPQFPIQFPPLSIGTLWRKDRAEPEILAIRLILERPSKQKDELITVGPITMERSLHRVNMVCSFEAKEPGIHTLIVQLRKGEKRWTAASRIPLEIVQLTVATPQ